MPKENFQPAQLADIKPEGEVKFSSQKFGFLVFPNVEELDLVGPWEIMNQWREKANGPQCLIVGETNDQITCSKGLRILPDYSFDTCPPLDYLLIPGGSGTRKEVDNPRLIQFVQSQASHSKHVIAVCTGAFILQKGGLLEGKKATTHWGSLSRLREFEEVEVVEKRYIEDDGVWTSAGVSAGIDLALAFVASIAGEKTAGLLQLHSEYYPTGKIYGKTRRNRLPKYIYDRE